MLIKLVRIGKDAELRSANGKPVLSLSVVYDVGYGANKKSQWLNLAMWGAQAEKTAQYFTKGKQIVVRVDDVHIEEYNGKSGLKGTLVSFEFVQEAKRQEDESMNFGERKPSQRPQQRQAAPDLDDRSEEHTSELQSP